MKEMFFKDWTSLLHVGVAAVVSYLALFIFIRISGKRTLAKLNAFDFVVVVTLGSTLSSMILAKVSIAEGALAVVILIALQYALAKLTKESPSMEKIINSSPTLLYYNGIYLEDELSRETITKDEITAAVREYRLESMDQVRAVVLELNGELAVVRRDHSSSPTSLDDVMEEG